ncbi:MAG: 50S ribosomal protein L28 [Thermodesulfobacteriota bacterium]
MAQECSICGKGHQVGHNVSHANNKTYKRWKPNLQQVKAVHQGKVKRINVCSRCLRSGKVTRAV